MIVASLRDNWEMHVYSEDGNTKSIIMCYQMVTRFIHPLSRKKIHIFFCHAEEANWRQQHSFVSTTSHSSGLAAANTDTSITFL